MPVYLGLPMLDLSKTVTLVWLCKTKIWWKCMLYGYRQLHCPCKNRWYLERYCKRFCKEMCFSNFEIDRPLPKGKIKK